MCEVVYGDHYYRDLQHLHLRVGEHIGIFVPS